jgi:predicted small integral membrane protein
MNKTLNTLCRFSSCVPVQGEHALTLNGNISVLLIFSCFFVSAPEWFGDSWMSKIKTDAGDNWRLKVRWITF